MMMDPSQCYLMLEVNCEVDDAYPNETMKMLYEGKLQ